VALVQDEHAVTEVGEDWLMRLEGVSFAYPGSAPVIDSVSLPIPRGVTSIVGPSGCGKSTLLGVIAQFYPPTGGQVRWNACLGAGLDETRDRRLGMVFQKDTVLPWLTVAQNVAFGLGNLAISKREQSDRVAHLLKLARLSEVADAHPHQLSGGMRRRVAFLTAVAARPRILLLDEPFSSLDEPTRVAIHGDVLGIVNELGMSVVLVTHDLGEAISLSDRVHILTRRPTRVAVTLDVPFAADRNVLTLRESPAYQELYRQLWHDLRLQIDPH
jgi:ABC-type nitrate/sulfonate/bicarbonate transport system ATPase subunit